MDFRQTTQPNTNRSTTVTPSVAGPEPKEDKSRSERHKAPGGKWTFIFSGILLIGIAVLLVCITFGLTRGNKDNENQYVDASKYQAVFLNNGQVYFGNIQNLNGSYVRLTNIYYLTQSGDTTSSNYSLVKLGCQQIHDPSDQMVINRDQVTFWENLQDNGKVVQSINQFKKQNPNGPDCSQVSNQTQASGNSSQSSQNSSSTGTGSGTGTSSTGNGSSSTNSSSTK